jgi:glucose-1-phosphate cytidylyltransferase
MSEKVPVAILCGGRGTRMGRASVPKGLIEIGGRPILWHIMKLYAAYGFDDFVLCLGYGADQIREAFSGPQPWGIQFVDTGMDTNTGGRIKKIEPLLEGTFMATYADGLARIDIGELLRHHRAAGAAATITCARAEIPFGLVQVGPDRLVTGFREKPKIDEWINGGFFVFEPGVFDYLEEDSILEREPFERLAHDGKMSAYLLDDFWVCMDTYKDALRLNDLWQNGAPWRVWEAAHEHERV